MIGPDDIRRLVARYAAAPAERVVALGRGVDHASFLVDDRLVVRCRLSEGGDVEREARLLEVVAEMSRLPVPRPAFVAPEEACMAYEWIAGEPLLRIAPATRERHAVRVAGELGRLLRALHGIEDDRLGGLVERDDAPLQDLLDEAAGYAAVVPARHRPAVEAFLDASPPPPPSAVAFSNNDLGIEHVLVDPTSFAVTGIIDWGDAALVDPARDFGLLLRDLGPAALDAALAAHGSVPDEAAFRARALFHARCALLEDLAWGLEQDRSEYVDKSLAGLAWLFTA